MSKHKAPLNRQEANHESLKDQIAERLERSIGRGYARWLAELGRKLDQGDPLVREILTSYASYEKRPDRAAVAILQNTIDDFCRSRLQFPKPKDFD